MKLLDGEGSKSIVSENEPVIMIFANSSSVVELLPMVVEGDPIVFAQIKFPDESSFDKNMSWLCAVT